MFAAAIATQQLDIAKVIYGDFLPQALANGTFKPAPPPLVVGHGLEQLQDAFELYRKGVSAKKLVITL